MKLTRAQIALIEQTLVLNKIVYEDVKLEIIDHIASDIEAETDENPISFEAAFRRVFGKWEPMFRPTDGAWLLGIFHPHVPRIVYDKWKDYFWRHFFWVFFAAILGSSALAGLMTLFPNEKMMNALTDTLKVLFLFNVLTAILFNILIWKTGRRTSYGHLFRWRSILAFLQSLGWASGFLGIRFFNYDFGENMPMTFFYFWMFFHCLFDLKLAAIHLKTHQKLNFQLR